MLKLKVSTERGRADVQGRARKVEVPEEALPMVKRLIAKYQLDFECVKVLGRTFYFLHVADLTPLLTGDVFKNAPEFPFWVKIWEASLVLAEFMAKMPPDSSKRILEVGAGMAVPGMVSSAFGHDVTVTDYENEILDFARVSSIINKCPGLKCEPLDWFEPSDLGKFDIILASEVLFHKRFFQPLLDVLEEYLAPGGVIYMSHEADRETLLPFFRMCEDRFKIAMQKKHFQRGDKELDILLTRLTRITH